MSKDSRTRERNAAFRRCRDGLGRDERGSVAIFIAAGAAVLVGALGLATDAARGYMVKARLSQAIDAAGIAGAQAMFSPTRTDDVNMYFRANFPTDFMGATVGNPSYAVDADNEKLSISATATIPTTFMRVLGIETMQVSAVAEVTRETELLEVVLAIDISGSMATSAGSGMSRLTAARTAALDLVNILYGDHETKALLKIGLVPWNSKVNVMAYGVAYSSALTTFTTVPSFKNPVTGVNQTRVYYANNSPVPLLNAPSSSWKGCVYQRYKHDGISTNDADTIEGSLTTPTGSWIAWQPIGPEGEPVSGGADCSSAIGGSECVACPTQSWSITPLQSSKSAIQAAISRLTTPTGNTNIPQGLGWAWQVVTHNDPYNQSEENPTGRRRQAIVLLTDGANVGGSGDGYKGVFGLGSSARPAMDSRLRQLAANIKASGVYIYAIQFGNDDSGMQDLLEEIATKPTAPYYNYAPDSATLQTVFQEVANHLSSLRLSR